MTYDEFLSHIPVFFKGRVAGESAPSSQAEPKGADYERHRSGSSPASETRCGATAWGLHDTLLCCCKPQGHDDPGNSYTVRTHLDAATKQKWKPAKYVVCNLDELIGPDTPRGKGR